MKVGFAPARGMHQRMSVLVGIPTHKRPDLLRQCLDSIAAQEGDLPPVRVFVADNDAKGQEGARLAQEVAAGYRFPISSTVVAEPGISAVRNAILDEARRGGDEFIAMIDDDETASPQWLAELLRVQKSHDADIVGGPCIFEFGPEVSKAFRQAFWVDSRPAGLTNVLYATNCVLMTRSVLEWTSWPEFDHAFGLTGGGDKEWFARMRKFGATFAWAPDAIAFEQVPPERTSFSWFLRRQLRVGINEVQICWRHGGPREFLMILIYAGATIAVAPILAVWMVSPKHRYPLLRRVARAVGRLAAVVGLRYREYAGRHG